MNRANFVSGAIGVAIGGGALAGATGFPPDVVMKIGPSFFPNILAGCLILFSIVLLINALRGRSKGSVEPLRLSDRGVQRGLITLGATLVFCAVLEPVGFIPTAIVFLAFMAWVLGKRSALALAVSPPLITLAIWLVFEKVLYLSLPPGLLVDVL